MITVGVVSKDRVVIKVRELSMEAVQLTFDPQYLGLERCPTCGALIERGELMHLGECLTCFRASIDS